MPVVEQGLVDDAFGAGIQTCQALQVTAGERVDILLHKVLDARRIGQGRADLDRHRVDDLLHGGQLPGPMHPGVGVEDALNERRARSRHTDDEDGKLRVVGRPGERCQPLSGEGLDELLCLPGTLLGGEGHGDALVCRPVDVEGFVIPSGPLHRLAPEKLQVAACLGGHGAGDEVTFSQLDDRFVALLV